MWLKKQIELQPRSPHKAFDAVSGGAADWLVHPFGPTGRPLRPATTNPAGAADCKVGVFVPPDHLEAVRSAMAAAGAGAVGAYRECRGVIQ